MELVHSSRPGLLRNGTAIALACSVIVGAGWRGAASGHAAVGRLSVATDPAEAAVYVDGRSAGASPLTLAAVAPGEHRVRIVKDGYLENARVVTVAAGEPTTLRVRLTRTDRTAAEQVVSSGGSGGGSGSKKWLYIAAAGGTAAAAGAYLATRNHPPNAGTVAASPTGTAIPSVTTLSFSASGASDPDGDSLSLTWAFGDGATATGATATHVFPNAGTFNVNVSVSDGKASTKSADLPITVRSVAATWVSNGADGIGRTWVFTQSGATVNGSYTRNAGGVVTPGTVTATMSSTRSISGSSTASGLTPFTFTGSFDSNVSVLTVVANGSGFNNDTLIFNRQ